MRKYPAEQIQFLRDNCTGRSSKELTALFNERFGTDKTVTAIHSAKSNYKCRKGKLYTQEHIDWLRENVPGTPWKDLPDMFNKHFGTSLPGSTIMSLAFRNGIKNGIDTSINLIIHGEPHRFKPGQVSHNKGKKGLKFPGSEKGWFKPGHMPHNYKPVGTERIVDGYVWVKIADPKTWKEKHRLIWEAKHGEVPEGYVIIFADGNRRNFDDDNLMLVTRRQLAVLNHKRLLSADARLTYTGTVIADLLIKISERNKAAGKQSNTKAVRTI